MRRTMIRSAVSTFIASLIAGCAGSGEAPGYKPVLLGVQTDPLAPARTVTPWRPPKQMAVFIHPHEDRAQGILIGGHWIMVLLGEGSWYFQDEIEREPIPDAEATPEEKRAALGVLTVPQDAVVPFRTAKE